MNRLWREGIRNFSVDGYRFRRGRLFGFAGPDLEAPQIALNRHGLEALASRFLGLSTEPRALQFRLYVSEGGEILDVESLQGPVDPSIVEELRRTPVLAPGRRGREVIPFVIPITIAVPER